MSLRSCKTEYGECRFYGKDEYIGRSLYAYGEWSGEECEKIKSLARGRSLDIGANIGFMTMALATVGPVEAFEPQPELFNLLVKNAPTAICHNIALGAIEGFSQMPKIRYGDRGNYGGLSLGTRSELGSIGVTVRTLDSFNYKDVGFIKVDVEGHELQVLKGATNLIEECSPTLYLEDDRPANSPALRKYLTCLGYKIEEHNAPMFRPNNFKGNSVNIWAPVNYISKNIICYK